MASPTAIAESAQALFCAIADYLGTAKSKIILDPEKYPTYCEFCEWWSNNEKKPIADIYTERVDTGSGGEKVSLELIEKLFNEGRRWGKAENKGGTGDTPILLKDGVGTPGHGWYLSSMHIGRELLKELGAASGLAGFKNQAVGWQKIFYQRGDEPVMANIEKLFKLANNSQKAINACAPECGEKGFTFGNVNKWSPADIYFASKKAKDAIKTALDTAEGGEYLNFLTLNTLISTLIKSGDLLPLSLKKSPTGTVVFEYMNFDRDEELKKRNKLKYLGPSALRPPSWNKFTPATVTGFQKAPDPNRPEYRKLVVTKSTSPIRDVLLKIDANRVLKFRHDAAGGGSGRFLAEIVAASGSKVAASARGGSLTWNKLVDIICLLDHDAGTAIGKAGSNTPEGKAKEGGANGKWKDAVGVPAEGGKVQVTFPTKGKGKKVTMKTIRDTTRKTGFDKGGKGGQPEHEWIYLFRHYAGNFSGELVSNEVMSLLVKWIAKGAKVGVDGKACPTNDDCHPSRTTEFIRLAYSYISATSPESGQFVIAK